MTQTSKNTSEQGYQELITELYRAFDYFNNRFAEGSLTKPIITIASAGKKRAYGWFGNNFWEQRGEHEKIALPEINLSAEHMDREPEDILETLLHEMAHLKNAIANIKDCSATQYHNTHFKSAAESFGLNVEKMVNKGWAKTSLGEEAKQAIQDFNFNRDAFQVYRLKHSSKYVKKYISLIVSLDYEEVLDELTEAHGMSRKELIEYLLDSAKQDLG